jgi:hypothetical protein
MRRDQASKDRLRALVGVEVEAQAEVSGTNSGTNGQNEPALALAESNGNAAKTRKLPICTANSLEPESGLEPLTPCLQGRERRASPRIARPGFGLGMRNRAEPILTMRGDSDE